MTAVKIPMAIFFTKMPFDIGHSFRIGKEKDLIFVLSIILPQNPEILKSKKLWCAKLCISLLLRIPYQVDFWTKIVLPGSVQFSRSVMSDSLRPHKLQHNRPPCPSPTPGVHSNSHPSSRWCLPTNPLFLCCPLLLLPPIPASIRVFSNESTLHTWWPKYWNFRFSISPSKEHLGLISFRMDWSDLLAVQGVLKSLLQQHSSKASIIWCSAFFL